MQTALDSPPLLPPDSPPLLDEAQQPGPEHTWPLLAVIDAALAETLEEEDEPPELEEEDEALELDEEDEALELDALLDDALGAQDCA